MPYIYERMEFEAQQFLNLLKRFFNFHKKPKPLFSMECILLKTFQTILWFNFHFQFQFI